MRAPLLILMASSMLAPASAVAQDLDPAERRAAAEAAYDRGTRAYRGGDYAQAARWYETANELAPAAAALLQAIRAHARGGNTLRAGTLVRHVVDEYGEDRARRYLRHLADAEREGFRVTITCTDCTVELDGEAEVFRTFFLAPDVAHSVVGIFEDGRDEEEVQGAAGTSQEIALEAPPPPPERVVVVPVERSVAPPPEDGGISPWFFISGMILTAAAGGVAVWSWLDTLSEADAYETEIATNGPTQRARDMLDAGRDLELRTTILDIGTAVLGATTLVLLIFTDFDGDPEQAPEQDAVDEVPEDAASLRFGPWNAFAGGRF